jgi:AcrR family transcriptional regulator
MLPSMATVRRTGARLSVDDWIQAGFAILADGGPNALRVGRLCERLGVTKGSFYWHFADMQAYRDALVESWGGLRDQGRRRLEDMPDLDPRQRLTLMMEALVNPRNWALERTMRVWALTDDAVADSVRSSDRRITRAVRQAFIDCGFGPDDADLRSTALIAAGIGLLHTSGSTPEVPTELRERFLDFMLRA